MEGSPIWSLGEIVFDPEKPDAGGVYWILETEEGFWAAPKTGAELHPRLSRHGAIRQVIRSDNPEMGFAFRDSDVGDNLLSVEVWPKP